MCASFTNTDNWGQGGNKNIFCYCYDVIAYLKLMVGDNVKRLISPAFGVTKY